MQGNVTICKRIVGIKSISSSMWKNKRYRRGRRQVIKERQQDKRNLENWEVEERGEYEKPGVAEHGHNRRPDCSMAAPIVITVAAKGSEEGNRY